MKNDKEIGFFEKLKTAISGFFYDISVKTHAGRKPKIKSGVSKKRSDLLFCFLILAWPTLQFLVFYVGSNINSFTLAFQMYRHGEGYSWVGFSNFTEIISEFVNEELFHIAFRNSLLIFVINLAFSTTVSLLFSYFIFKKIVGFRVFRVILFLPSIISSIVIVMVYKYFVENGIPYILDKVFGVEMDSGLLTDPKTAFGTLLFKILWFGFGANLLIYLGAMGSINPSILEADQLDGCSSLQEFFYVVFPMIYPTFTTFFVTGIASLFTNQMDLFSFYGTVADDKMYTVGYYLYIKTYNAGTNLSDYPHLAAFGLILTAVTVPVTLVLKNCMEKWGPKEED